MTLLESVPDPVWIGLNDRDSEGRFTWADGTQVLYTNWDTNEPNDNGDGVCNRSSIIIVSVGKDCLVSIAIFG